MVWRNTGVGDGERRRVGHWLAIRVRQPAPDVDAVGGWLEVRAATSTFRRELTSRRRAHLGQLGWSMSGLGPAASAEVRVTWPDGEVGPWLKIGRGLVRGRASAARRRSCPGRPARVRREQTIGRVDDVDRAASRARRAAVDSAGPRPARCSPTPCTPSGSRACASAQARRGSHPYRRLCGPRALGEPLVPHRVRSAFRGSGADPRGRVRCRAGDPRGQRVLGLAGSAPLPMRRHRYQELSLPSQPRDRSETFPAILADGGGGGHGRASGSSAGSRCGGPSCSTSRPTWPTTCAHASARPASLTNATALLIDPADGLRIVNEVEQLAAFEDAACRTSEGVLAVLRGVRPGMTEAEAVALLGWDDRRCRAT